MPTSIETPQVSNMFIINNPISASTLLTLFPIVQNDITIGEIEKSMGANGQSQRRDNVFARVTECYKSAIPCTTNEFCHAQAGCSGCLFFVVTVGGICF